MTTTEITLSELPGTQRIEDWEEYQKKHRLLVDLVKKNVREPEIVTNLERLWFEKFLKENQNPRNARNEEVYDVGLRFFRFWYALEGKEEIFHNTYSLLRSEYEYFEDGLWECIKQFRYFSPNTHYFEVYPSARIVDIYLRKGYQ